MCCLLSFFPFYHIWLQSPFQPQCISKVVLWNMGNFCLVWGCLLGKTYDDLPFRVCYKLEALLHLTAARRAAVGREGLCGVPGSRERVELSVHTWPCPAPASSRALLLPPHTAPVPTASGSFYFIYCAALYR